MANLFFIFVYFCRRSCTVCCARIVVYTPLRLLNLSGVVTVHLASCMFLPTFILSLFHGVSVIQRNKFSVISFITVAPSPPLLCLVPLRLPVQAASLYNPTIRSITSTPGRRLPRVSRKSSSRLREGPQSKPEVPPSLFAFLVVTLVSPPTPPLL